MNPVVGLDVAKGESQVQAFLDKKTPYKKSFKISHTVEGFVQLLQFFQNIEEITNTKPVIIMESTGHYHSPVIQFLDNLNYIYIVINPLISYRAKSTSLRKVKTDVIELNIFLQ